MKVRKLLKILEKIKDKDREVVIMAVQKPNDKFIKFVELTETFNPTEGTKNLCVFDTNYFVKPIRKRESKKFPTKHFKVMITVQKFDINTGKKISKQIKEIVDTKNYKLFENCNSFVDIADKYMKYCNMPPNLKNEMILVQNIQLID